MYLIESILYVYEHIKKGDVTKIVENCPDGKLEAHKETIGDESRIHLIVTPEKWGLTDESK